MQDFAVTGQSRQIHGKKETWDHKLICSIQAEEGMDASGALSEVATSQHIEEDEREGQWDGGVRSI